MNTATHHTSTLGIVSIQERFMRSVFGISASFLMLALATTPWSLFIASVVSFYLVFTAIIGLDSFYALTEKLATATARHPVQARTYHALRPQPVHAHAGRRG